MAKPTKRQSKYCAAHYRGQPRNPTTRHAWRETSRDRVIECRYCYTVHTIDDTQETRR